MNVVLIMADDLGYEAIAANGGTSYKTPNLDKMAREGMRFTHAYSQPSCTPSRVKLMTGKYNWRNYRRFGHIEQGERTFAHLMKTAGYATAMTGKWQLWGGPTTPTHQSGMTPAEAGFDEHMYWAYDYELSAEELRNYRSVGPPRVGKTSRYWHPAILKNGRHVPASLDDYGPDMFADFAVDFIKRNKNGPFFLYYPMTLPHSPWVPTPSSKTLTDETKFKGGKEFFADSVAYADHLVGRLVKTLDDLGIGDDTLVLFTGDNGTSRSIESNLGEHAIQGGKGTTKDAGTHVPMFARWIGTVKGGAVNDDLIDFTDFYATLADLVGLSLPSNVDGRSFLPQLRGQVPDPRDWLFMHYDKAAGGGPAPVRFARTKQYKLYGDGRFFDVPSDREEQVPLETLTARVAAIRSMLQEALDQMPPTVSGAPTDLRAVPGPSWIQLSWKAPANTGGRPISGYKIEVSQKADGGGWRTLVANTGSATTTYRHVGLKRYPTRSYRVRAINSVTTSAASNKVSATAGAALPPMALSLEPGSVSEGGGGTAVTVTASLGSTSRSEATEVTVSVIRGGTATARADFKALSTFTVTIPAGQPSGSTQQSFEPKDDVVAEGAETVILSGNATGFSAGIATLTIADNDTAAVAVSPSLPNVVVILADDLGFGDVRHLNPQSRIPTPNLDALAVQGMNFIDAHTPSSVCTPTRYGLLTGRYPWRSRRMGILTGTSSAVLERDRQTIGTLLQAHGYRTSVIGKWHLGLGFTRTASGIDYKQPVKGPGQRGFDESFITPASPGRSPYIYIRNGTVLGLPLQDQPSSSFPRRMRSGKRASNFDPSEVLDELVRQSADFIRRQARERRPFLLYLPLTAPHIPVWPAERFEGTTSLGPYGDFVAQLDSTVGYVMNAIDTAGISNNTLVIFTSDNGSFMRQRSGASDPDHTDNPKIGAYRTDSHTPNYVFRGTKRDIWEGGHRVPFFVHWPGKILPGSVRSETVSLTDVFATLAEIVGERLPADAAEDSFSLLPLFRGRTWARPPVIHQSSGHMFAIREGRWKLVAGNGSGGEEQPVGKAFARPYQLFDLEADPSERMNLYDQHRTVADRLEKSLEHIRSRGRSRTSVSAIPTTSLTVLEGMSSTYTVALATQPLETVTVTVGGASGDVTVDKSSLSFTTLNWRTAQTVTVSAAEDDDPMPDGEVTLTHTASGGGYDSVEVASVTVMVAENDTLARYLPSTGALNLLTDVTDGDTLVGASGATLSVQFGAASYTATEGGTAAAVTVSLSADPGRTVSVPLTQAPVNAAQAADYSGVPPSVTFSKGQASQTFTVTATDDGEDDDGEAVDLGFGALPTGVTAGGQSMARVSLVDNDATPALSVSPAVSGVEGEPLAFAVQLSAASGREVTVAYATADGTARASEDYTAASGTLAFAPGETTKTVEVATTQDELDEEDETFELALSSPTNAEVPAAGATATGTILDDDTALPELSIQDSAGGEGSGAITFTVRLAPASSRDVTVRYATSGGTATQGTDYTAASGTLTFAAATTEQSVEVAVADDGLDENDETFAVTLDRATNAAVTDGSARGMITDNDGKPNVLFISVDDLNDWIEPLGGHPQAKTPNLKRLAGRSTLFSRAYAAAPLCNPSRAALLTGIAPWRSGVYDNQGTDSRLPRDVVHLPQAFMAGGYRAIGAGKIYHRGNNRGRWDEYWPSLTNHKPAHRNPVARSRDGAGKLKWGPLGVDSAETSDGKVAAWVSDKLREAHDQPFFMACGIFRPHLEWYVPQKFFDRFPPDSITLPRVLRDDLEDVPAAGRLMATKDGDHAAIVSENKWRDAVRAYLATVNFADEMLGLVLDALDESGRADNTIVVLWGDHGWHLGEKERWRKSTLWDEATRVPLIIYAPPGTPGLRSGTRGGSVSPRTVNLLDVYPTLLELAGLAPTEGLDGRSVVPLLENPQRAWQPTVTTHGRNNHAVRSENFRYIRYADGSEELYDHRVDPNEWTNQASNPDYRQDKKRLARYFPSTNAPEPLRVSPERLEVTEGSSATYEVALTEKPKGNVTVAVGGALGDVSVEPSSLTFTKSNWEVAQIVTVSAAEDTDTVVDPPVTLTHSVRYEGLEGEASGRNVVVAITESGQVARALSVEFGAVAYTAAEGGTSAAVTVSLSAGPESEVTVPLTHAPVNGAAAADYSGVPASVTFSRGETSSTFSVTATDDSEDDDGEAVDLGLGSLPTGVTAGGQSTARVSLVDDDATPTLSVSPRAVSGKEGESLAFTVNLSAASGREVTVAYATADGTATQGTDYAAASGTLGFAPGETAKTVEVATTQDELDEEDETFELALSSPTNAEVPAAGATATGTIRDDDTALPELSIQDGASGEDSGTITFTVELAPASSSDVTVGYATSGDTATQEIDYVAASGTLAFAAGTTRQTVEVMVVEDPLDESDETFAVTLSDPVGAVVTGNGIATGTIRDNDATPTLSVSPRAVSGKEGESLAFAVKLSAASAREVTVAYATADGTATQVTDYVAASGTLTFRPGETEKAVEVATSQDELAEEDETFTLALASPTNATVLATGGAATGTIRDDDEQPQLRVAPAQLSGKEGASLQFAVKLSEASAREVTAAYATADGTAKAGEDYVAASGTLTFRPGETEKAVEVATSQDELDEEHETFTLSLGAATNATVRRGRQLATATIRDDDEQPRLGVSPAQLSGTEGASLQFAVKLSAASAREVTAAYATADGTAKAGEDYVAASGTLTFRPGETEKAVEVATIQDELEEEDETFTLSLGEATNARFRKSRLSATATVRDDDRSEPERRGSPATITIWSDELGYRPGERLRLYSAMDPQGDESEYTLFVYRESLDTGERHYLTPAIRSAALWPEAVDQHGRGEGDFWVGPVERAESDLIWEGAVPAAGLWHFAAELRAPDATTVLKRAHAKFVVARRSEALNRSGTERAVAEDLTLRCDTLYSLRDRLAVQDGATLTIEAGALLRARGPRAEIVVEPGGRIEVQGRQDAPVVMTCAAPVGRREPGCWGGLRVLGRAPVKSQLGAGALAEVRQDFGGDDPHDSSGTLRYLRVEFAGGGPSGAALALHGVGDGTRIEHVQAHASLGDGIAFRGGTAECGYCVASEARRDALDWAQGWQGTARHVYVQQGAEGGIGVRASGPGPGAAEAVPTLSNVTLVGVHGAAYEPRRAAGPLPSGRPAIRLEEGAALAARNTLVVGFGGPAIEARNGAAAQFVAGGSSFTHAILHGNRPWRNPRAQVTDGISAYVEYRDDDPDLLNIRHEANPDPRPRNGSAALPADGAALSPAARYVGAFGRWNWLEEWTFFGAESDYAPAVD
ncbi:MAG: sulfatase-like hydrolase/transferase [Acidobacteria bacterium]|nr:sulfatase-like hydrolase/transferase [Acidobacteriota bacterium]